ncbi:hypothetical protein BCR37DRAFT_383830 [Protomyces lactucae-debilis]|uniref:BZIP domain-containing protein n=1 Tax=Protomyces lactucae-debilis TaxID=2754530 RepID=A0A1Y2EW23_PROLT|nr:uncharacterized protein BCR37DRAFT_383830 [Protomyces lactucae-debilis]ORY75750.1 hypothetical protein BCR37DRAFT_383830 [Protomyces lactucae-debilis]
MSSMSTPLNPTPSAEAPAGPSVALPLQTPETSAAVSGVGASAHPSTPFTSIPATQHAQDQDKATPRHLQPRQSMHALVQDPIRASAVPAITVGTSSSRPVPAGHMLAPRHLPQRLEISPTFTLQSTPDVEFLTSPDLRVAAEYQSLLTWCPFEPVPAGTQSAPASTLTTPLQTTFQRPQQLQQRPQQQPQQQQQQVVHAPAPPLQQQSSTTGQEQQQASHLSFGLDYPLYDDADVSMDTAANNTGGVYRLSPKFDAAYRAPGEQATSGVGNSEQQRQQQLHQQQLQQQQQQHVVENAELADAFDQPHLDAGGFVEPSALTLPSYQEQVQDSQPHEDEEMLMLTHEPAVTHADVTPVMGMQQSYHEPAVSYTSGVAATGVEEQVLALQRQSSTDYTPQTTPVERLLFRDPSQHQQQQQVFTEQSHAQLAIHALQQPFHFVDPAALQTQAAPAHPLTQAQYQHQHQVYMSRSIEEVTGGAGHVQYVPTMQQEQQQQPAQAEHAAPYQQEQEPQPMEYHAAPTQQLHLLTSTSPRLDAAPGPSTGVAPPAPSASVPRQRTRKPARRGARSANHEETPEEREHLRSKNTEAAARSRLKKREMLAAAQARCNALEIENAQLRQILLMREQELAKLKGEPEPTELPCLAKASSY